MIDKKYKKENDNDLVDPTNPLSPFNPLNPANPLSPLNPFNMDEELCTNQALEGHQRAKQWVLDGCKE